MLIGEVAARSGLSARMLRHYDALGLVSPTARTAGGYREYSPDDLRRLFHVESLRTLGMSLSEAKSALDDPGFAPAGLVSGLIRHTRQRIAAEQELLATLARVDAAAPTAWEEVLRMIAQSRALASEFAAHRQRAALSPATLPVETLVEALLAEDDANVAGALRWALARAGDEALPPLDAGMRSTSVEVRRRAAAALDTPAATAALRGALSDADAVIRERAALVLGGRGESAAAAVLLAMVAAGRSDVEAAEALGRLASEVGEGVAGALRRRFDGADDLPTRLRITQALAEIPGPGAEKALAELARHPDRSIAATASAILATRGAEL